MWARWATNHPTVGNNNLPNPTRPGFEFLGWFTAQTGGTQITATTSLPTDRTVYARWESHFDFTVSNGEAILTRLVPKYSGLTNIEIPTVNANGVPVTAISWGAFSNTGITSIIIPDSVTTIASSAFAYCGNLESVVIGSGVTFIGTNAFGNCGKLTSLTFRGIEPPELEFDDAGVSLGFVFGVFGNFVAQSPSRISIYVPIVSLQEYKEQPQLRTDKVFGIYI